MSVPTPVKETKALAVQKKNAPPAVIQNDKEFKLAVEPGRVKSIVLKKSGSLEDQVNEYINDINELNTQTVDEVEDLKADLKEVMDKLYATPAGKKIKGLMDDIEEGRKVIKEIASRKMGALGLAAAIGVKISRRDVKSKLLNEAPASKQLTGGAK